MKKLIALVIVAVMLLSMMPMMALAADDTWTVAGEASLLGKGWDVTATENDMETTDGTNYTLIINDVSAGYYKFKVVKNHSWAESYGRSVRGDYYGNYCIGVSKNDSTVTIAFNKTTHEITVSGENVYDEITVYVKGTSTYNNPSLYAWLNEDNTEYRPAGSWPGTKMTAGSDGWYTSVVFASVENIIINNTSSPETKTMSVDRTTYSNKIWIDLTKGEFLDYVDPIPHTIIFNPNYEDATNTNGTTNGGKITLPSLTRAGWLLEGWYTDADCTATNRVGGKGDEVTFTANTELYANWTQNEHTVTFNLNYDGTTPIEKVTSAETLVLPDEPTRPNYTFAGWYLSDTPGENDEAYAAGKEITSDTTLYAKWNKKATLTLSFNLNGGDGTAPADVSSVDGVVALPAAPSRSGYTFKGWYDAATGGNLVIAANATTYTFTGDADAIKTLYAQWEQNQAPAGPSLSVVGVLPGLSEWTPTDPNAVMTPKEGNIYEYLFEDVAANTAMTLKITTSAGWNDAWNFGGDGNTALTIGTAYSLTCNGGSANLTFTIDTACDVKVTLNLSSFDETTKTGATLLVEKVVEGGNEGGGEGGSVTPPPATEDTYIVAGTANLCGTEWDPSNAANKLTKQSDGTYTITYNNVEADNYALKVTNGTWDKAWPTENYAFGVTEKCNVTVTFNPETKEVKVTGDHVGEPVSTGVYIVAGSAGLCGEAWNTTLVANKMTKQSDGTYTITYTDVAAGDYEFKVTDGTWNNAWPNQNYALSVAAKSTVTITFNADAETVTVSVVPVEGEGGEQGGSTGGEQGGTEGGNQSGTTGNPEAPTGSLIIHAKVPAAWASAYLYAWNTGDDVMASWPGTAMTKGDDGWYAIEIPAGYKNIIVAEKNGGEQTVDLSIANVTGNEIWVTLGEKNAEGKYPATIAEDEKGEDVVAPPEVKEVVVYAQVPADWSAPYVYAWNGSANNASWPGVAMTKGENGWWYAKVPASVENVIISNKGTPQTVDLKLEKLSVDVWVKVAAAGADGKYNATTQYSSPATGDTAIIAPVVFLMVMSVTGLAVLTVGKKKYF